MPKAFEDCVRKGGKVITVKPSKSTYKPVCKDKGGWHAGHTKTRQSSGKGKRK